MSYYSPVLDRVAAECIAALRRDPVLTVRELAFRAGAHPSTVSSVLRGGSAVYGEAFRRLRRRPRSGDLWRLAVREP